jgi:hypothetical protein
MAKALRAKKISCASISGYNLSEFNELTEIQIAMHA